MPSHYHNKGVSSAGGFKKRQGAPGPQSLDYKVRSYAKPPAGRGPNRNKFGAAKKLKVHAQSEGI